MNWKDILVYLDESKGHDSRMALAIEWAREHGAHLRGMYRSAELEPQWFVESTISIAAMRRIEDKYRAAQARARHAFESAAEAAGVDADWHMGAEGGLAPAFNPHYSDLIIAGQREPGQAGSNMESVLLSSGRPVVFMPYIGAPARLPRRVLIAWNETKEATRAVHEAMPLLWEASQVDVLTIAAARDEVDAARDATAALTHHLSRHGVNAAAHHQLSGEMEVAGVLLSNAADLQSEIIVMGAYGHSRLREWVLGGATRGILEHMTVPVFMVH
ncbi:MAG: universal stress protein [Gammaproteobacteria bacterium]|nr:universal stress protein [Gammaproteobacteria bacterium]